MVVIAWRDVLGAVYISCLLLRASALIISAPEECGGPRVIPHASALFGPRSATSNINGVPMYAAFAPGKGDKASEPSANSDKVDDRVDTSDSSDADEENSDASSDPLFFSVIFGVQQAAPCGGKKTTSDKSVSQMESLYDGCEKLEDKQEQKKFKGKVAMVIRGNCDFAQKVYTMQKQGSVAVVLVNVKSDGDHVWNMKRNETKAKEDITIPSLMITYNEWRLLSSCRNDNITMSFTPDGEVVVDIAYGKDVLTWAIMRGMALWILFQCGVNAVRYKRRHNELSARAEAIATLPSFSYRRRQSREPQPSERGILLSSCDDDPVCAICLENFQENDTLRRLACAHTYHMACIDPWLTQSSSCPVCKRNIPNLPPPPSPYLYGSISV